ncbi:MAG: hypothetical protein PHE43_04695 [Candidatus Nanoarchaeia archaeon]|nr:hypothetical protein [Candidatus Nanoarchaeia archaeon]
MLFGKKKKEFEEVPVLKPKVEKKEEPKKVVDPYLEYVCNSCRYNFRRKRSANVEVCPYCGKKAVEPMSNRGAQIILDESSNRMFDR